jgi:hypothetical protein
MARIIKSFANADINEDIGEIVMDYEEREEVPSDGDVVKVITRKRERSYIYEKAGGKFQWVFTGEKEKVKGEKKGERKSTAYNRFVSQKMGEMKEKGEMSGRERLEKASKMWKGLSYEEKRMYDV